MECVTCTKCGNQIPRENTYDTAVMAESTLVYCSQCKWVVWKEEK